MSDLKCCLQGKISKRERLLLRSLVCNEKERCVGKSKPDGLKERTDGKERKKKPWLFFQVVSKQPLLRCFSSARLIVFLWEIWRWSLAHSLVIIISRLLNGALFWCHFVCPRRQTKHWVSITANGSLWLTVFMLNYYGAVSPGDIPTEYKHHL